METLGWAYLIGAFVGFLCLLFHDVVRARRPRVFVRPPNHRHRCRCHQPRSDY